MAGTTITINIETEVLKKLRELAIAKKQKKGFLGKLISEATKEYLKQKEQEEIAQRQLKKIEIGYNMGKILIKHRDELYDRK
ncbi:hypothetical protein J4221_01175 [Candidatus Pacearchaeota archaeon]|nr:hypothetical protein [Candidatus Pacearchaeota archaeon]